MTLLTFLGIRKNTMRGCEKRDLLLHEKKHGWIPVTLNIFGINASRLFFERIQISVESKIGRTLSDVEEFGAKITLTWVCLRRCCALLAVCCYAVKPYIPRVWLNCLDFLAIKSDAYQFGPQPVLSVLQKWEAAVEVAAAHSNSMKVIIECNNWSDDNINLISIYSWARNRLP